ncbi:Intra-flagellar transport protein 57 [Trinorchestia longiramus]|nr:Intra-flagellar transport protein 57 [Trinorchestia longiramus]
MSKRSESARSDGWNGDGSDMSPGLAYSIFISMEELLDKLKLLNYDQQFVSGLRMKPLNRHYFALATSPGEQFYLFVSLAVWLINNCGHNMEQPQESDDPNSVISNILDYLRQKGETLDFPPSKLKAGSGEQVIYVLDCLADFALKAVGFTWQKTEYPVEAEKDEEEAEDEAEVTLEKVEEEMQEIYEDDEEEDEENIRHLDDFADLTQHMVLTSFNECIKKGSKQHFKRKRDLSGKRHYDDDKDEESTPRKQYVQLKMP